MQLPPGGGTGSDPAASSSPQDVTIEPIKIATSYIIGADPAAVYNIQGGTYQGNIEIEGTNESDVITINLQGNVTYSSSNPFIYIKSPCTLTINGGECQISNDGGSCIVNENAKVTVNGGVYQSSSAIALVNRGTMTLKSGTIQKSLHGIGSSGNATTSIDGNVVFESNKEDVHLWSNVAFTLTVAYQKEHKITVGLEEGEYLNFDSTKNRQITTKCTKDVLGKLASVNPDYRLDYDETNGYVYLWKHSEHDWQYSANKNVITANCAETRCPYYVGDLKLTLNAPEKKYENDGKNSNATITQTGTFYESTGWTEPEILYDAVYDWWEEEWTSSSTAPTTKGEHTAQITVGGATAKVTYEIGAKQSPTEPVEPTNPDDGKGDNTDTTPSYTISVADGTMMVKDGETGETVTVKKGDTATVKAGDTVTLTLGEAPDGMSFQYWDIPQELYDELSKDSKFSNKEPNLKFEMPKLSDKTTTLTIKAMFGTPDTVDDTDYTALGIATGVVGGTVITSILGWQAYSLASQSYLELFLPYIPTNRQELATLLWEDAGKPEMTVDNYADIDADKTDLQTAARWAVAEGLMDEADAEDESVFAPGNGVSKWTIIKAWHKAQKLKKQ